jgi:hypothetical protein
MVALHAIRLSSVSSLWDFQDAILHLETTRLGLH